MSDIFGFPDEEPRGYSEDEFTNTFGVSDEPRYTLEGDMQWAGEHWSMTGPEWVGEAYKGWGYTEGEYGLAPHEIIDSLISVGYDYDAVSEETGETISGLWRDWRELYGETA